MNKVKRKRKWFRYTLITLVVFLVVGYFIGNRYVKKHGYKNLWHFITNASSNYNKSKNAKFETLEIKIKDADFSKLKALREKAIKRGIQINEGGGFVNATLTQNGKKIKAKIRLKGHMTDHLQDKKWSFRIHTKKGEAFMGMKMFSLQNPGTRNYIYEWIYHQLMKDAGIVALRYDFIKVKVNGEDWGIYALEENFGQQLIQNNKRVMGPIVRFDPELYWISRINELDKVRINEEYATMQSAFIDVYDEKNVFGDSVLLLRYNQAVKLMEAFRRGKLKTAEAFDIKKLAKFHAIIDLVGGHHSIDWSDIKYYYNPESNLLEPVAYESFSVNPTGQLTAAYKFNNSGTKTISDWHSALFSDPVFFKIYMKELNQIVSKKWLDKFFKKIKTEMDNKLAILYNEYYTKEFKLEAYYTNQNNIKHLLASPSGFIAYFKNLRNDSIFFQVGGVDALPYEITELKIDSIKINLQNPIIVDPKTANSSVEYSVIGIPMTKKLSKPISAESNIRFTSHILGYNHFLNQKVQTISLPDELPLTFNYSNFDQFPFISNGELTNEIHFKPGNHLLNSILVIKPGKTLIIPEGTTINFGDGGGLISYSPVLAKGSEDFPIQFISKSNKAGIIVLLNSKNSKFEFVQFLNAGKSTDLELSSAVRIYNSSANFSNCDFTDQTFDGIRITKSTVKLENCRFASILKSAIKLNYSNVEFVNISITKSNKGIESIGSKIITSQLDISKVKKTGIDISQNSYLQGTGTTIIGCKVGFSAADNSTARIIGLTLQSNQVGLKASQKDKAYGNSQIDIRDLTQKNNKQLSQAETGSKINIIK